MSAADIAGGTTAGIVIARAGLTRRFAETVAAAHLPSGPGDESVVTQEQVDELPVVVRRYLHFMGVIGRPRDWSFRAQFIGRFWLRRGLGWMPAEAWQYNSAISIGRVFVMRVRVAGVVPMIGCDTYLRGHGHMIGKLLDRFTVVDGSGEEFDVGGRTTYLNEAILLAPSMLLGPETTWTEVDARSFDVTLLDSGRSVTGRVFLDDRGAPVDFSSTDRFAALPSGLVRAEWHTPVRSWQTVNGRPTPGPVSAVWHFPHSLLPYIKGEFVANSLAFNIAPASVHPAKEARSQNA